MHWLLVRLLRAAGDDVPASKIRKTLRAQFSPVALAVEADYIAGPGRTSQRPYGWGWALALVHEAWRWDDPEGSKWAAAMAPLADTITGCFLDWLPKATYPVRCGVHTNSAFGLSRALGYAQLRAATGDPALLEAIAAKAFDWFAGDTILPRRVGAIRPGFSVSRLNRGGAHGADPAAGGVRRLAVVLSARDRAAGSPPRCSPR